MKIFLDQCIPCIIQCFNLIFIMVSTAMYTTMVSNVFLSSNLLFLKHNKLFSLLHVYFICLVQNISRFFSSETVLFHQTIYDWTLCISLHLPSMISRSRQYIRSICHNQDDFVFLITPISFLSSPIPVSTSLLLHLPFCQSISLQSFSPQLHFRTI